MLLGIELTAFLYLLLCAVFWILRPLSFAFALGFFVFFNVAILYILSVVALALVALQVCFVFILYLVGMRLSRARANQIAWLAFASLLPVNVTLHWPDLVGAVSLPQPITELRFGQMFWAIGVNFMVLKSFIILKDALSARRFPWLAGLAALTFVPAFGAGPIHGSDRWTRAALADAVSLRTWTLALLQCGWGIASLYVISPFLIAQAESTSSSLWAKIPEIYLRFAALYFDFAGYSLIAIAFAAIFGAALPANFNKPYLAVSITDFWRRWHMSLSSFIGTYLYKPFVRVTGSAQKGIFLAFSFAGLWHEMTIGYLLWGIGHGAALSIAMKPPAMWTRLRSQMPGPLQVFIGWFLTMTWVASLSYVATRGFKS